MRLLATIIVAFTAQITFGYLGIPDARLDSFDTNMLGSYLIILRSDTYLAATFSSPHAQLYYELTLRGINWTTAREYNDEILTGAILDLGGVARQVDITEVACIESISPVLAHASPQVLPRTNGSFVKRASGNDRAWSDPLIGVRSLHVEGYRGRGIKIGIIGSGVDYSHSALGGSFGPGRKVIGGYDFVGDDYTGEIDSVPQPSWDPLDQCRGHGTMIAGIIGANPGNPDGITGVAYEASLNVYRIYGCEGGTSDAVLIDALLRAKKDGNNIVMISMVPSNGWTTGAGMVAAGRLAKAGIMVVIPAGSDGKSGFWRNWDSPEKLGIVSVGSASRRSSNGGETYMAEYSSYGPTNDLHMSPTVSAPGFNMLSTFPASLDSYQVDYDTSYAAAFFVGAAALWMQAQGKTQTSSKAALSAFQNTAIPLQPGTKGHTLAESLAHQGSGLIDAYKAVHATGSMQPAQLLLNDTINFRGARKVRISNTGKGPVVYTLQSVPAYTLATIGGIQSIIDPKPLHPRMPISPLFIDRVVVPARSTRTFALRFMPPVAVPDASFLVYSGHIQATGSDGSVLRSSYIGLAASMKQMQIIDDTDSLLGAKLPYVADKNGDPIEGSTTYKMIGKDKPVLIYRLVGCTRILRLDLVNSDSPFQQRRDTNHRRSIGRDASSPARRALFNSGSKYVSRAIRRSRFNGSGKTTVFGTIFERISVQRHVIGSDTGKQSYSTFTIKAFADGSIIPNGAYRVLLRALKITGNPKKRSDWETWISPEIVLDRPGPENNIPSGWALPCFPHCFPPPKAAPVIQQVDSHIWTFSVPFARFNILPVGGRSTAIRLGSGDVWLLASTPCDDVTKKKLAEIGPVKYLIAPDLEHHLYLTAYKAVYPDAKVIGVPALVEKKKGQIVFDGVYGQDPPGAQYGYEPEIQARFFPGFVNQDVAFLHVPSKTLIEADLLFNLPGTEQYSNSKSSGNVPIIGKFGPRTSAHKWFVWKAGQDRPAMARDARVVASWDFDRIIPCHGDVIETGGNAMWREAYKRYLDPKAQL